MQSVFDAHEHAAVDPFKLKNPNAFDPARRRSVRAMKVPRESVEIMAAGIDAAEHSAAADVSAPDSPPATTASAR